MRKLLLTGASGFLGWNILRFPQEEWDILGTYNRSAAGINPKFKSYQVNLKETDKVRELIKDYQPDAILHLAALSGTNYCEEFPDKSYTINVSVPKLLAEISEKNKIHLVFTSSGQVFDGLGTFYEEYDLPNPQNVYGKQKAKAEKWIQKLNPNATIARVPVMYGQTSPTSQNFLFHWFKNWRERKPVKAYEDEIRTFLSAQSAAEGLFLLLREKVEGIFHIGGAEALSRYEFAHLMRKAFEMPDGQIIKSSQSEANALAYRPPNITFTNRKMMELGFQPRFAIKELKAIYKKFNPF